MIICQPTGLIRFGDFLNTNFNDERWNSFLAAVAFVKRSGVQHIATALRTFSQRAKVKMLLGIDLRGTSREGLNDLLECVGPRGELWICHNENPSTFHPKVYIFSNEHKATVVVGSGNLTEGGLYTNYEASFVLNFVLSRTNDRALYTQIITSISEWHNTESGFSLKLTPELIGDLSQKKYIVNEAQSRGVDRREQEKASKSERLFPRISVGRHPLIRRPSRRTRRTGQPKVQQTISDMVFGRRVLWRKELAASDVQRQPGHPTGVVRLTQAEFTNAQGKLINHVTYFRELFDDYAWRTKRRRPFVEEAVVPFELIIDGQLWGAHNLSINHKPSGEAGQRNYTSSLKWGALGSRIKEMNLTGKTITIYDRSVGQRGAYIIVIE